MSSDQKKKVEDLMKKGAKGQLDGGARQYITTARVKNKQPAPVQITAEQILREARERQEADPKAPKSKITDPDELADYRQDPHLHTFFCFDLTKSAMRQLYATMLSLDVVHSAFLGASVHAFHAKVEKKNCRTHFQSTHKQKTTPLMYVSLVACRLRKRKEFEDGVRRNRNALPLWVKYAMWEETQLEFDRCVR
jgi:hypothetical protein